MWKAARLAPTPTVDGWVEYLHWSPNGTRLLLGVAGRGADTAAAHGAITAQEVQALPSWMPAVDAGNESCQWRRIWVYELATNSVRQVSAPDSNIWEAVWCGNDAWAAVASPGPEEGLWFSASLQLHPLDAGASTDAELGLDTRARREIYKPQDQLGWPAASPSGNHLAVVEALCSDRWLVAGTLRLIDTNLRSIETVDTHGVDITHTEWRSDRRLLLAGHRGFDTVVGIYDLTTRSFTESWTSRHISTGGTYITVSGFNEGGDCVLVGESFVRAPEDCGDSSRDLSRR